MNKMYTFWEKEQTRNTKYNITQTLRTVFR